MPSLHNRATLMLEQKRFLLVGVILTAPTTGCTTDSNSSALSVTDLYTTAARIAGATDKIPSDRVTDGIDQTNLLLLGGGNSKRNYMFHYGGDVLDAVRYEDFKIHIKPAHGGLPGMDFFNIKRDPGEKYGALYPGLFVVTPIQMLMRQHMGMLQKFPHRPPETPSEASLTPHD